MRIFGRDIFIARDGVRDLRSRGDSLTRSPVPFPQGYTLEKWLESPTLAEAARELFDEDLMKHMMAVLYNSIPSGYPHRGQLINETSAAIELGRIQGYMDCLNLLNSLAVPKPAQEEVPVDFNAEEVT